MFQNELLIVCINELWKHFLIFFTFPSLLHRQPSVLSFLFPDRDLQLFTSPLPLFFLHLIALKTIFLLSLDQLKIAFLLLELLYLLLHELDLILHFPLFKPTFISKIVLLMLATDFLITIDKVSYCIQFSLSLVQATICRGQSLLQLSELSILQGIMIRFTHFTASLKLIFRKIVSLTIHIVAPLRSVVILLTSKFFKLQLGRICKSL